MLQSHPTGIQNAGATRVPATKTAVVTMTTHLLQSLVPGPLQLHLNMFLLVGPSEGVSRTTACPASFMAPACGTTEQQSAANLSAFLQTGIS